MNAHSNTTTATIKAKAVKIGSPSLTAFAASASEESEAKYQEQAVPRRAAMQAIIDGATSASYALVQAAKFHLAAYTERDLLVEPALASPGYADWEAESSRLDVIAAETWLEFLACPCIGAADQNLKAAYVDAIPGGAENLDTAAFGALVGSLRSANAPDTSGVTAGSIVYVAASAAAGASDGLCIVKEVLGDAMVEETGPDGEFRMFRRDQITHWLEGVIVEGGHRGAVVTNPPDDSQLLDLIARFDALRPAQKTGWAKLEQMHNEARSSHEKKHGPEPHFSADMAATQAWRKLFNASALFRKWSVAEEEYSRSIGTPAYMLATAIEKTRPNTPAGFAGKMRAIVYTSELNGGNSEDFDHRQLVTIAEEAEAVMLASAAPQGGGGEGKSPSLPDLDLADFNLQQLITLSKLAGELGDSCNEFSEAPLFKVKFETGPYKGAWDHTANGKIVASITEWADNQSDRAKDEIEARQPTTAPEAYARCIAMVERHGKNDESLEGMMAIVAEGIEQERALSAKAA